MRNKPWSAGLSDWLALAAGAMIVVLWVLLLQTHTSYHARFMVRILVVPLALGFAAFVGSA
jgi:VIT1/CCC1 family predicted Fe2+/Mn2+ transporter